MGGNHDQGGNPEAKLYDSVPVPRSLILRITPPSYKGKEVKPTRAPVRMMAAKPTGNPDRDFAAMMIPHHQGAIDMAKVELIYGRDPVLRRLAQGIIVTQQQEIELMQRYLQEGPAPQQ
jgi:uncharacterized protein (DUF305 family)